MKLFYLLFYVASAIYVTYVGLYLRAIHLSGAQIGLVVSIVPLAGVALQPLWGYLSDRYRQRKLLFVLSLLLTAAIAPTVALAHSFLLLVPLVVALAISLSPAIPLADATTLEWLSRHRGSYGSVRIYGSLGFIVGSLLAGLLLAGPRLRLLFPLYGLGLAATCVATLAAPRQQSGLHEVRRGEVRSVLANRVVMLFLLLAAIAFGTSAAYNTFFALYMRQLGAGTPLIGVAAALASLSELPVMAVSGWVVSRFGVKPLLLAGFGTAALRWTLYGLVHDIRIALALQLLHGLTFAGSYVGGVTFMELQMGSRLRSTGQTLFYGSTFGLGAIAGANLFGYLFDRLTVYGMFLAAGGVCAVALVGLAVLIPNSRPADFAHSSNTTARQNAASPP